MTEKILLNGEWQFSDNNEDFQTGYVPGSVQRDLIEAGKKPDPFYRMNEYEFYELEEKDWVYKKEFSYGKRNCDKVVLTFEGLDTCADIYLNKEKIGEADNMFIQHDYEITSNLIEGNNIIEVYFKSTLKKIKAMEKTASIKMTAGNESARPYLRKAQYQYGWDWGPRIVETGIWKDVYISIIKNAVVKDVYVYTKSLTKNIAKLILSTEITGNTGNKCTVTIKDKEHICHENEYYLFTSYDGSRLDVEIPIENPNIWHPNGRGNQPLYKAIVACEDAIKEVRFAIRTIELTTKKDEIGESFIFKVNDSNLFIKGANWIPADSIISRVGNKDYYQYVKMAKDANMNMLRVWGGGIYENEAFYNACDEMGILVWQDFMYACAQYPDHLKDFRETAAKEAIAAVKRLRNHPCIAVWCGNNENNWFMHSKWNIGQVEYMGNFIYKQILPSVCSEYDPGRAYWTSSPWGGRECNDETHGDRHNWEVWAKWQDFRTYKNDKGRFLSEFGFMAMPCMKTVFEYTEKEDRHIFSPAVQSHVKAPFGADRLLRYIATEYGLPLDFSSYVYLTQLMQAEVVKFGVEHWRRRSFDTGGTIYWQLNDCWPVASWASIDYKKRKKALYFYTKHFYNNILVSADIEPETLQICICNDNLYQIEGELNISTYHVDGRLLGKYTKTIAIDPNSKNLSIRLTDEQLAVPIKKGLSPQIVPPGTTRPFMTNLGRNDVILYAEYVTNTGIKCENVIHYNVTQYINFEKPNISVDITECTIKILSDKPAVGVFIETENEVDISDNCLKLKPGQRQEVLCSSSPGAVKVLTLLDFINKI